MRNTVIAVVLLALIGGFLGGFAFARQRYIPLLYANSALIIARDNELTSLKAQQEQRAETVPDNTGITYFMENGVLMIDDGASFSAATAEASTSGGTRIMLNGTIVKPNGNRIILSEHEFFGVK